MAAPTEGHWAVRAGVRRRARRAPSADARAARPDASDA